MIVMGCKKSLQHHLSKCPEEFFRKHLGMFSFGTHTCALDNNTLHTFLLVKSLALTINTLEDKKVGWDQLDNRVVFLCAVNYLAIEKKYENQLLAIFFAKMQQRRRTRSKCRKSRETAYYVLEKRRRFLFWQTGSSKTLLHIRKRLQKCIVVEN